MSGHTDHRSHRDDTGHKRAEAALPMHRAEKRDYRPLRQAGRLSLLPKKAGVGT